MALAAAAEYGPKAIARTLWEQDATLTVPEIAAAVDVKRQQVTDWAEAEGWCFSGPPLRPYSWSPRSPEKEARESQEAVVRHRQLVQELSLEQTAAPTLDLRVVNLRPMLETDMTREERRLEVAAMAAYNTHWGPLPTGKFPPVWQDLGHEAKEFVRAQVRSAIKALEQFDSGPEPHSGLR